MHLKTWDTVCAATPLTSDDTLQPFTNLTEDPLHVKNSPGPRECWVNRRKQTLALRMTEITTHTKFTRIMVENRNSSCPRTTCFPVWEGKWRRFNCVTSNPLNGLSCASSAEKQRRMTEQGESRVIFSTRSICSSFRARALSVGFADSSEASLGPGQWPHSLVPLCTERRLFVASRARTPLHPPPENSQSHCKVGTGRPP
ncbi:uncharacterized protein [Muntiacus reevesi]